jgi:phosphate-selective porin OprO/OprP
MLLPLLTCLTLSSPQDTASQERGTSSTDSSLIQRLDALEQAIRLLNDRRESGEQGQVNAGSSVVQAGPEGFLMKSADGRHVLKFRGYLQTDSRFYMDDATDPSLNNFLLRRVRPVLEGTLSRMFDVRFMPDFA